MALLNSTTINGNLDVSGEYSGNVVKANGIDKQDGVHQIRLGWNGTNGLLDIDNGAAVHTLLAVETDRGALYHRSSGTQLMTTILDGTIYYYRPMSGISVSSGSANYPYYAVHTDRLTVHAAKPVFPYVGSDGGGTTVSYATNCFVGASGILSRTTNTSSQTVKHDIQPLGVNMKIDARNLYDVEVVQFKYNEEMLPEKDFRYHQDLPGFIIEDLDKKYPIAIDKDGDNVKHWSWNSQYLIPPMLKLIQEQKKEIDELKDKVSNLEAKIN